MKPAGSDEILAAEARVTVAELIALDASRLARLAKENGFDLLAYLIDMAVLEAWREAGGDCPDPAANDDSEPPPAGD